MNGQTVLCPLESGLCVRLQEWDDDDAISYRTQEFVLSRLTSSSSANLQLAEPLGGWPRLALGRLDLAQFL